ncbi:MAG: nicotinamide riboside transporter PnuC [Bacteroidia bacterium]
MLERFIAGVIQTSTIEWIAVLCGILYVVLAVKQNYWCWPFGIVSSALYIFINYQYTYYWDALLQIYYCLVGVYGCWIWYKNPPQETSGLKISKTPVLTLFRLIGLICILAFAMGYLADIKTDSTAPYADGALTAASFIATWMTARKWLENWLLWVIIDLAYIPLYLTREAELTAVLYLIYAIFAAVGFISWKKQIRTSNA